MSHFVNIKGIQINFMLVLNDEKVVVHINIENRVLHIEILKTLRESLCIPICVCKSRLNTQFHQQKTILDAWFRSGCMYLD